MSELLLVTYLVMGLGSLVAVIWVFVKTGFGRRHGSHRSSRPGAFRNIYSMMNHWANHGVISYGHFGAEWISLVVMRRIPVYMPNVAVDEVFQPKNWAGFGTADLAGADYRACQNFGPLYAWA